LGNLQPVGVAIACISLGTQVILLVLQLKTFRYTRHFSLALLAAATLLGVVASLIVNSHPFIMPSATSWQIMLIIVLVIATAHSILGIWGAAALFRSYRDLSGGPRNEPTRVE
jgi:hypothetical protein